MRYDAKLTRLKDGRVRVQVFDKGRVVSDCTTQGLGPALDAADAAIARGPSQTHSDSVGIGESVVCVMKKG